MNWLGKQLPDLNDRSQNAGTQVALSCACVLFVSSIGMPACLPACLRVCPACCARPRATQCPLPVPSHAVCLVAGGSFGGSRVNGHTMWADTDVDAGVAADVNEDARLVISKSCTQPARAGCVWLSWVGSGRRNERAVRVCLCACARA